MSTGRLLGEALGLIRRRRVLGLGVLVALLGLVYAALYVGVTVYNPHALADLGETLTTNLPPALPLWLAGGALLLIVGGLLSEGGLILTAGRRAVPVSLYEPPAGASSGAATGARRPAAIRRLPQLLVVAFHIWWPTALILAVTLAPAIIWYTGSQDQTQDWLLLLLGSACCSTLVFLAAWLIRWPLHRLANCALLLDGQAPRTAVRTARQICGRNFGAVAGLWIPLLLLNALLLVVSVLLAALAAGLVDLFWSALGGAPENVALIITLAVALLIGAGLLLWDGAVSAFNLNTWVLAYRDLRPVPPAATSTLGTTQILGRQRLGGE